MLGMKLLRLAAICSSLGLLFGCVWLTQKQANPTMMPSSKLLVLPAQNPNTPPTVFPGSKSGTLIMPGSKSWTGGATVSRDALKMQPVKPQTVPASKP